MTPTTTSNSQAPVSALCSGTQPRPLMPMQAAMWWLDLHEAEVVSLIESGSLLWAFDIALSTGNQRKAIRLLTESVENLVCNRANAYQDEEVEWRRVAGLIFPDKPTIVTCELARSLNCNRQHTLNLLHEGQIRVLPGARFQRGPGGSPQIVTQSAKEWLRKRRVC